MKYELNRYSRRYAKSGFIKKNFIEECLFCKNIAPENIEHMLLECTRWRVLRADILAQYINIYRAQVATKPLLFSASISMRLVAKLLGEELKLSTTKKIAKKNYTKNKELVEESKNAQNTPNNSNKKIICWNIDKLSTASVKNAAKVHTSIKTELNISKKKQANGKYRFEITNKHQNQPFLQNIDIKKLSQALKAQIMLIYLNNTAVHKK
ncbi:hypothetical protein BB561_006479 [Smittium simulii]|uniref:Uncharacterized protein n=1 Tax=Smittium simulii TaxID=133385 RepID=A0A2T9Y449_9FUNG|nr:hypothetical protein BB561_006479 [Smittium simulii]